MKNSIFALQDKLKNKGSYLLKSLIYTNYTVRQLVLNGTGLKCHNTSSCSAYLSKKTQTFT